MPRKLTAPKPQASSETEWVPLADAAAAFAPRALLRRARTARKKPLPVLSEGFVSVPSFLGMNSYFSDLLAVVGERSEPHWEMRKHLLEKLRSGFLEASGVRVPMVTAAIEPIPAHLFDEQPQISWTRNTLKNFGVELHRVRVRPSRTENLNHDVSDLPKTPQGRPSKEAEIERAIDHALDEGHDLREMPRKQAVQQVRIYAEKHGVNVKYGFSASTVQRILLRRLGKRI